MYKSIKGKGIRGRKWKDNARLMLNTWCEDWIQDRAQGEEVFCTW